MFDNHARCASSPRNRERQLAGSGTHSACWEACLLLAVLGLGSMEELVERVLEFVCGLGRLGYLSAPASRPCCTPSLRSSFGVIERIPYRRYKEQGSEGCMSYALSAPFYVSMSLLSRQMSFHVDSCMQKRSHVSRSRVVSCCGVDWGSSSLGSASDSNNAERDTVWKVGMDHEVQATKPE